MPRDFDGSSDFLDGGDITALNSLAEMSFHIWTWVDHDATLADMLFFEKATAGFAGLVTFMDNVGPNANNVYEMFNSATERIEHNVSNLLQGQWVSIGGYVDWTGVAVSRLYVNGVENGNDTFATNNMATNDLLLGVHVGPARYLDGKLANFSIWDEEVSAANFVSLAAGGTPSTVHASGLLLEWDIDGDTSPEPENITGSDTLAVTGATKSVNPVIATLAVENVADNTCDVTFTSNLPNGTFRAYISTSVTPPSAADLKAGTGAVATASTVQAASKFTGGSEIATDVGSFQSVATDGTWFFTTAGLVGVPDANKIVEVFNSSWVSQSTFDTAALVSNAHSQVNGMFVNGSTLYVTANNFSASPEKGWVFEFSINAGTGALTATDQTLLSIVHHPEQPFIKGDYIWIANHDYHGLDRYDVGTYANGVSYAFPVGTDPGVNRWQSLIWFDDTVVVNVHGSNANSPISHAYDWDGSAFATVNTAIDPPTAKATQGTFLDPDGATVYWAERNAVLGDVWSTTGIEYSPTTGQNRLSISCLTAGTDYYAHVIQDHTFRTDSPWDSNILTSSQFTTTGATPATSITVVGITDGANLSSLSYAVFDSANLVSASIIKQGSDETTDSNGDLVIDLTGLSVTIGAELTIVISDYTTTPTAASKSAVCYGTAV